MEHDDSKKRLTHHIDKLSKPLNSESSSVIVMGSGKVVNLYEDNLPDFTVIKQREQLVSTAESVRRLAQELRYLFRVNPDEAVQTAQRLATESTFYRTKDQIDGLISRLRNRIRELTNDEVKMSTPLTLIFSWANKSEDPMLTPSLLGQIIFPYLSAIDKLQQVINEINLRPYEEIRIKSLSQQSPVSVSLDGADGAIRSIQEIIVPWRRQHAEIMAKLAEQEKYVEIETKKAEVLEKRGNAARTRAEEEKIRTEIDKQKQETEKLRLENEKLRIEVQRAKVGLALQIIQAIAPSLSETGRIEYLLKLLPAIDVIGTSDFQLEVKRA